MQAVGNCNTVSCNQLVQSTSHQLSTLLSANWLVLVSRRRPYRGGLQGMLENKNNQVIMCLIILQIYKYAAQAGMVTCCYAGKWEMRHTHAKSPTNY
jgi:hypothetical protein